MTFTSYTCHIYDQSSEWYLGFEYQRPLAHNMVASYVVRVPQAEDLPPASFPPYLTVTQLPSARGSSPLRSPEDFHLQVINQKAFANWLAARLLTHYSHPLFALYRGIFTY